MPKIEQRHLQCFQRKLSGLIYALEIATAVSGPIDFGVNPKRQFRGLSRFLKGMLALPVGYDLSIFEIQLKRRLVRIGHRIDGGFKKDDSSPLPGLGYKLRLASYGGAVDDYRLAASSMLRRLSDVDIRKNHQQLITAQEVIARSNSAKESSA